MELVYKLLVQGTHLRVHQLLVNSKAHSENVHLLEKKMLTPLSCESDELLLCHVMNSKAEADLLLHQILQMCDPLCIFWVTADVVFVKEGLLWKRESRGMRISYITDSSSLTAALPHFCPATVPYLLISGDAPVHSSIYDPIEAHAERVDVAMMLPVLVLADESPQLLGLILHHVNGILQRAHLHLEINTHVHQKLKQLKTTVCAI